MASSIADVSETAPKRAPRRSVPRVTTAMKVSLMVGVLFGILAVYFYFVPINLPTSNGVFGCGSASNPPTEKFPKGVCQQVPDVNRLRAGLSLTAGVLTAVLGVILFPARKPEGADRV